MLITSSRPPALGSGKVAIYLMGGRGKLSCGFEGSVAFRAQSRRRCCHRCAPPLALFGENDDEPDFEDFIRFIAMQSSPVTAIPRRRRCVVSATPPAITSFGCLTRRSPDVRVKTSATGNPENDTDTPDQVDRARDREIEGHPTRAARYDCTRSSTTWLPRHPLRV